MKLFLPTYFVFFFLIFGFICKAQTLTNTGPSPCVGSAFLVISGANSYSQIQWIQNSSLRITNYNSRDQTQYSPLSPGDYSAEVTINGKVFTTNTITVKPDVAPFINIFINSGRQTISYGTVVSFLVYSTNNGGSAPSFQWKKNNINVGTNSTTYLDPFLEKGDFISCTLTSNAVCANPISTVSNTITMNVSYLPGASLDFEPSNSISDHGYIPYGGTYNDLNISIGTIEAWIKPRISSQNSTGIENIVSYADNRFYGLLYLNGQLLIPDNYGTYGASSGFNLADGNWHHVALTFNNEIKQGSKCYIDGVLTVSGLPNYQGSSVYYPNYSLIIGGGYSGLIDEVRLWNRVLTQCEIQNNLNCELASGQTGLVRYYNFNEGHAGAKNASTSYLFDRTRYGVGYLTGFTLSGSSSNWVADGAVPTGNSCKTFPGMTWTGVYGNNWANSYNWSPNCVPGSTDDVTIPNTGNQPMLPSDQSVGRLTLAGSNKVMLGDNNLSLNAVSGGSSSSYIVTNGTGALMINNISSPTVVPVGTSASSYDPVLISPTTAAGFSVNVKAASSVNDFSGTIASFSKVAPRQWEVKPMNADPGSTSLTLTNGGANFTPTKPVMGHYKTVNGVSSWEELPATSNSGSWTATTTSFSPFAIGEAGAFLAPLPVELLSFKAEKSGIGNLLTWVTASEVNNKGFEIERLDSANQSWVVIGFVAAQGKPANYNFTDNTPLGISYYRLRQIDYDGKTTFSYIVSVLRNGNSTKLKVYPTITNGYLNVETEQTGKLIVFNLLGQLVLSTQLIPRFDVSTLPSGPYILKVGNEQVLFVKQ